VKSGDLILLPSSRPRSSSVRWESKGANFGYDAQNDEYGDLIEKGIIDPAKVVRTALQDAASIAGLIITTEAGIAEAPKKGSGAGGGGMPGGMGGMGGMDGDDVIA
jgi:chaperonin GroEL